MPASFTFYNKPNVVEEFETFVFSPNTNVIYYTINIYDSIECTNIIGIAFSEIYNHTFSGNKSNFGNTFIKFFENSGLPYGDDNILVTSGTSVNKVVDGRLIDGTYIYQVNSALSSGEYSGQVGNATCVRNRKDGLNDATIVNFPLPILTYTNAFNSLPQPSTAPLPA